MASVRSYRWLATDDLWRLAARFLAESGYADTSTFREAIITANPQIIDPANIQAGALITLPYLTS